MRINDIVIVAPIFDVSGIAEVARNLYLSLFDLGVKVKLIELKGWSHLVADINAEVRDKLNFGIERNDIIEPVVIHLYPPNPYQQLPRIEGAKANISYTLFETNSCPRLWRNILNSDFFIENWVPTQFNKESYINGGINKDKLKVIPFGVDVDRYSPTVIPLEIENKKEFSFMTAMDWSVRKNPEMLIESFFREFNNVNDACFIIKAYTGSGNEQTKEEIRAAIKRIKEETQSNANLLLITDFIHSDKMPSFHRAANAWVNTSRGEGWDMGSLQSMACGVPVIGTDNSAHKEYLTRENGYLIRCTEEMINGEMFLATYPQFIGHSWWGTTTGDIRNRMRKAYDDWKDGKLEEKGKLARKTALEYSWNLTATKALFEISKL